MHNFFRVFTFAFASSAIRYVFFAGVGYIAFYTIGRRVLLHRKIQARFPQGTDYLREIAYSLTTSATAHLRAEILSLNAANNHGGVSASETIRELNGEMASAHCYSSG